MCRISLCRTTPSNETFRTADDAPVEMETTGGIFSTHGANATVFFERRESAGILASSKSHSRGDRGEECPEDIGMICCGFLEVSGVDWIVTFISMFVIIVLI